tara:strand:+ start:212 stop:505 length:294 start_codon:yes stop_codon:yes gene_type:complete
LILGVFGIIYTKKSAVKKSPLRVFMEETVYHIYAKDRCLYNCLKESEFEKVWRDLRGMVGLMKTDYTLEDLSYEKLPPGIGGVSTVNWKEPDGGDSY